jgi:hypothetical protein
MTKKEKKLLILLLFSSMTLVGVILNTYTLILEKTFINISKFNNIVLKSTVISFAVLIVIIISKFKKFKND